jgi:hypothetical protein
VATAEPVRVRVATPHVAIRVVNNRLSLVVDAVIVDLHDPLTGAGQE